MMTVLEAHRRLHPSTGAPPRAAPSGGGREGGEASRGPAALRLAGIVFNSMYPGCIAQTQLFREKRDWFRYFFFPTLMKADTS